MSQPLMTDDMDFDEEEREEEQVQAQPVKKKAKKIVFNRPSVHAQSARVETDEPENAPVYNDTNGHIESHVPVVPNIVPILSLKPRGDKNFMRVMELEKEVLELYKMLDYWKNESKTL